MSKATKVIAALHHSDEANARNFCELVQRYFPKAVPQFMTIAGEVRVDPAASAAEIAARIGHQVGVEVLAQPRPAPKPKTHKTHSHQTHRSKPRVGYALLDRHEYETPAIGWSNQRQRNPALSQTRLEPDKASKCPHGVPFYRKCAICDPKGFAESTGLG